MTETNRNGQSTDRIARRNVLRVLGVASLVGVGGLAGCLGSAEDGGDGNGGDSGGGSGDGSVGAAEITFLGETYTYDDASCEGSSTFPPENEQINYRNVDEEFEFWVEREDPEESDGVEVHLGFPTGDHDETIGGVEAYDGRTTIDEVEFELGSHTSGSLELEPHIHMNDDVDHEPDGGVVEWDISC